MRGLTPNRFATALAGITLCLAATAFAQGSHHPATAPLAAASFSQQANGNTVDHHPRPQAKTTGEQQRASGDHLREWINHHANLPLDQQQKALEAEPGFRDLPASTQQRMRDHLAELNAMPPAQRQRLLEHNEAMERLTPDHRGQVRDAMNQLKQLPDDQRRYVARTFRGLRELSPAQRQNVLNSERFSHLTDAQRATLNSLMKVEPLLPPPYDSSADAQPAH